ncbi:MAG: ECF transporter S component [Aigarchaeota archaeon]|nr:ECF transporter S component [Candidatus Calditenuis fumarioli]
MRDRRTGRDMEAGRRPSWTVRDLVGLAALSVVSGLVFAVWSHLVAPVALGLGGHLGVAAIYGVWYIGGTLPAYVLRRRWAAFVGETIGAIVELLLVSPYSVLLYYYGPVQGIMSEAAFALRRYRKWGYGTMALAGALPVIAAYPFDCLVSPFYPRCRFYPLELHTSIVAAMVVSGALLGGVLVKAVVDALVAAGRLKGWPVAQAEVVQGKAG